MFLKAPLCIGLFVLAFASHAQEEADNSQPPQADAAAREALDQGRPEEVYLEEDRYVVIEAEHLKHSKTWAANHDLSGDFYGDGWLTYAGPPMGVGDPETHNTDPSFKAQGDPEDWLIMWVKFQTPGKYTFRAHVTHKLVDGDNDAWIGLVKDYDGLKTGDTAPDDRNIPTRWGDSEAIGKFGWNSWGPVDCQFFVTEPGVYGIYVAGRSPGFSVDRFIFYQEGAESALTNRDTPESRKVVAPKQ